MDINNELGFKMYRSLLRDSNLSNKNFVFSPFSASAALAMVFLGARSRTSWQINGLLRLDEMITFNPHLLYKEINDLLADSDGSACVKGLYVDKDDAKDLISYYMARIDYFYRGMAEKISFEDKDAIRKSLDKAVEMQTDEEVQDFSRAFGALVNELLTTGPPMALYAANYLRPNLGLLANEHPMSFINLPSSSSQVPDSFGAPVIRGRRRTRPSH